MRSIVCLRYLAEVNCRNLGGIALPSGIITTKGIRRTGFEVVEKRIKHYTEKVTSFGIILLRFLIIRNWRIVRGPITYV